MMRKISKRNGASDRPTRPRLTKHDVADIRLGFGLCGDELDPQEVAERYGLSEMQLAHLLRGEHCKAGNSNS